MSRRSSLPQDMQAVEIQGQNLRLCRRPVPLPGPGEVLIRVHAAGVNRPDVLQRKGLYPPPSGVTDIPGLEVAGEIVGTGRKVCALVQGGGYAAYCVAAKSLCLPLPNNLDWAQAAAIPEVFFTAWRNLRDVGKLKTGETVLIHGGGSGVGTAAIQVARTLGARVFVTAGSQAKLDACLALGAEGGVNYKTEDFVPKILAATEGRGVDLVLDMVGGDYVARNLKALAPGGRHVSIAMMQGRMAPIDIFEVMSKQLTLTGSTLRAQPLKVRAALARDVQKALWPSFARGAIRPVVDRLLPLSRAEEAHNLLESGGVIGKIVLMTA